ncbi:MAG: IPT/TIG domain-containing protein [Azospirillaceae bacterium]|nr:IPT/TIG domain-containing protein [Azospirillaceae bacterium]
MLFRNFRSPSRLVILIVFSLMAWIAGSTNAIAGAVTIGSGFTGPYGIAADSAGNVFVAEYGNNAVKEIVAVNGVVSSTSTVKTVGNGFNKPVGVAVDSHGNVFVSDAGNTAVKEIVAVNGVVSASSTVKTVGAGFVEPYGVAVDASGNVFVADVFGGTTVKEIVAVNGVVSSTSTVKAIGSGFTHPNAIAVDSAGNVFVTDNTNSLVKEIVAVNGVVSTSSTVNAVGSGFSSPNGVAVDSSGNVFVSDYGNFAVKEIVAVNGEVGSTSTVKTIGTYTYALTGVTVDSSGNVFFSNYGGGAVYKIVPSPTITGISPATGPTAGGTSVTITGTNFTGATAVKFSTASAASFSVVSATSITATSPAGSAGAVDVTVTTPGGTSTTSTADKFTYIASAPTVTGVSPATGPVAGGTWMTITGTGFTGATSVKFGTASVTSFNVISATMITGSAPAGSAGVVDVTVTTAAGTSATSAADQFTYIASAPTVTGVSPATGPVAGGTAVTISGANFTGATAVKFGSASASSFTVVSATSITATSPAGSAGWVDVTVTTAAGTSTTSPADQFTYGSAPTVTGVSPATGPVAGGTAVTISGTNFTGATAVKFGSASASGFAVVSATSITATSPAGSAGWVDVTVTTAAGTSTTSPADQYTYGSAPTVTGVSPATGPVAGGTAVTISGTNFTGATAVKFGSASASGFAVVSATSITATSPAGSAGWVDVTVTTAAGTSTTSPADQFTYGSAPTVTGVSPATGPVAGGTAVTISGTAFTGATSVKFGGASASGFTVVSATSITATSPAGSAGVVDVTVTSAAGTSTTSAADQFTYTAAPVVTGVIPKIGDKTGGTAVTVSGSGFTGATSVRFGSVSATAFSVVSAASITATSPAGSTGTVDITVTGPAGTSTVTAADQFSYAAAPVFQTAAGSLGTVAHDQALSGVSVVATGTGTISYAVTGGALPAGVTLGTGGALSGTPSVVGTSSFTITATDATTTLTTARSFSLTVGYVLTVTTSGAGSVRSSPAGLTCVGASCTQAVAAGNTVTLTATPTSGASLTGWGGACAVASTAATASTASTRTTTATTSAATTTVSKTATKTTAATSSRASATVSASVTLSVTADTSCTVAFTTVSVSTAPGWVGSGATNPTGNANASVTYTSTGGQTTLPETLDWSNLSSGSSATLAVALPANSLTSTTGLTITASQANGAALPSWLTFDASSLSFSGTPPASWLTDTTSSSAATVQTTAQATAATTTRRTLATAAGGSKTLNLKVVVQDSAGNSWTFLVPITVVLPRLQEPVIAISVTADVTSYGNGNGGRPALSRDGRFTAWPSAATNLTSGQTDATPQVYRYAGDSGLSQRFSNATFMGTMAGPGDGWSGRPAVSGDGRFLAFASDASDIIVQGPAQRQVYLVRDDSALVTYTTVSPTLVSTAADGSVANCLSDGPALSSDGTVVVFESLASNLVAGVPAGVRQIYRKDLGTGLVTLVSASAQGIAGDGASVNASVSDDGRFVAFESDATTLVAGTAAGLHQVYVTDTSTGLVTALAVGTHPQISGDGRFVVFDSTAAVTTTTVPAVAQVYRSDRRSGTTTLVSADATGQMAQAAATTPAVSGDGRFVAYVTAAANLTGGSNSAAQVVVQDVLIGTTALVSTDASGNAGNGDSSLPAFAADGRTLGFVSVATNLAGYLTITAPAGITQVYLASNPLTAPVANGWWWNPSVPGRGYAVEAWGNVVYLANATYAGDSTPVWYSEYASLTGGTVASGSLLAYQGGQTLNGSERAAQVLAVLGTQSLTLNSASAGTLTGPLISEPVQRDEFVTGGLSAGPVAGAPETGWWWNPAEPGRGWFLEVQGNSAGNSMFFGGFFYDNRGQASWATATGAMTSLSQFTGSLMVCTGDPVSGNSASQCQTGLGQIAVSFTSTLAGTLTLPSGTQVPIQRFRF